MKKPCHYLIDPKQFGKTLEPRWRHEPEALASELEAAKIQNECAFEMRKAILAKYGSVSKYCRSTQQDYQRIGRVLRGEIQLRSEDLGQAAVKLGISVRFISKFASFSKDGNLLVAAETARKNDLGAFYTPDAISDFMVNRILGGENHGTLLEPSFGDGAFIKAALDHGVKSSNITGVELDAAACNVILDSGLGSDCDIENKNFFDFPAKRKFDLAIGNPPYVRIRRLRGDEKQKALSLNKNKEMPSYGEESSLWFPFLLKCVDHLNKEGNLALVLPYEITYVRYARHIWSYLSSGFNAIEVVRIKDRIFGDLMQDVVLLFCYGRGGSCDNVRYICAETLSSLKNSRPIVDTVVNIKDVEMGARAFQKAMVPREILDLLDSDSQIIQADTEVIFHIGYVCGNKNYFHPSSNTITQWKIPKSSLLQTAVSTRRLKDLPLKTSASTAPDLLWLPQSELSDGEGRYIAYGEKQKYNESYKCKKRSPWWRVPAVKTPDVILSVFSDAPRLLVNDADWTFSNSLLGGYLKKGIDAECFAHSWYTAITLLSIELEVHSLGGGVLVVVPREANRIHKMAVNDSSKEMNSDLERISKLLEANDIDGAYHVGDELLERKFGADFVKQVWQTIEILREWRKRN